MKETIQNYLIGDTNRLTWNNLDFAEGVAVKNLGTADGFAMQLFRFKPGAKFPRHIHDAAEFVYLLEGELMQNNSFLKSGWFSISQAGTVDEEVYSPTGAILIVFSKQ